jgi:broad specificity phosphatase PhoE
MAKTSVFLVRHGTTALNHEDKKLDRVKGMQDHPLDERGIAVAHQAGEALKKEGITHVFASPLKRSVQTAQIIAHHTGAKVGITPRLNPLHVGLYGGRPYYSVSHLLKWHTKNPHVQIPGGESVNDFHKRFASSVPELLDFAKGKGKKVAVVVHSRHLHHLDAVMKGDGPENVEKVSGAHPPGSVLRLDVEPSA